MYATEIANAGLTPIIEPEIPIHHVDKKELEQLLFKELKMYLEHYKGGMQVVLKLTIPEIANTYHSLSQHKKVRKLVGLSGGYDTDTACKKLKENLDMSASFSRALSEGLFGKAMENKLWNLENIDIRKYSSDKNLKVDDTPYGGGSGMLIKPDVVGSALDNNIVKGEKVIFLTPRGKIFNQKIAKELSSEKVINIICGRFEGIDQRVIETRNIEEYSIGDFILSGGESASFVFVDALVRLLPGVLGNINSIKEESFENNLLEYPQYTKPRDWEGKKVPEVLFSGDHAKIKGWRLSQSEAITRRQRPDLWKKYLDKKNEKH